jgi:type IV secretion system protein VirB4
MSISAILSNQPASEDKLPKIGRHVTPRVVNYEDGRTLLVIKLAGMPFESLPDSDIKTRFDSLNRVIAAVSKAKGRRLAWWTTLRREKVQFAERYAFKSQFMRQFSDAYLARFDTGNFYENSFYISVLLKYDDLVDGAGELEEVGDQLLKALAYYDPEPLVVYERNGIMFSQVYKFLGWLLNGIEEELPVLAAPAYEIIPSSWLHWGYDTQEIRCKDGRCRFATSYDLKDFPETTCGMFDNILSLPAEFTFTQSFTCLSTVEAMEAIKRQLNKLESVRDKAEHQKAELRQALGYITSGELAFGDYHGALTVFGESEAKAIDNGSVVETCFLTECGARFVKAARSAPFTYLSHVPGAKVRPRPQPKSSRNLAAAFGMHNYSSGKSSGNPIGDGSAVMPLQTTSESLYSFNFHYSKEGQNNLGEKVAGHVLMHGTTGAGKTTLETSLIGFLERFENKLFALDKDEGLKIFIASLEGLYFTIRAGEPTGLAPFQLPDTPETREFLYELVTTCGRDSNGKVSATEQRQIKQAVDSVLGLPLEHRQFSRLLENIPDLGGDCLAERLGKWCHAKGGRFAWALDNAGSGNLEITYERIVGFDVSDFLKPGYEPTEPVLAYLFHLKKLMQRNGGLLATIVEEYHVPVRYPSTAQMVLDVLKTGRKRDEFIVLVSQSPEDAIKSDIFDAIRDLTPTKIYLPNPSAEFESYRRCNVTRKEFDKLKELELDSRTFLIKQGNQSCFAKLDLFGLDDAIAVLSGSTENVAIFNEVVEEVGTDPEAWMSLFQARRKGKKSAAAAIAPVQRDVFAAAKISTI